MSLIPDRIRWHDDMLVTSRHVEELSLRLEALVHGLPSRYGAFCWGVTHLDVRLHEDVLAVMSLDAVMPNGLHVAFEGEDARLQLDLRSHVRADGPSRVLVHLAAPHDQREDPRPPRFVASAGPGDMVGDDGMPIERRRSRATLFAGEAPAASRYASFPLLEVSQEGGSAVVTDFVPPLLQVAPDHPLALRCAAVAERLRREVAVVANRSMTDAPIPFRAEARTQINPAIGALPPFEVLAAARPHPLALYVELCRVASAAAALRDRIAPPVFPAYAHGDLRATFEPVFRFVLGGTAPISDTVASFTFERDGAWFRLPPDQGWGDALEPDAPLELVLALQADTTDALGERWGEHCVIASRSAIQSMLARRVVGLRRRRVHGLGALPVERDVYLFRLERDPDVARPGEDLLVLGDLPGVKALGLTLYAIRPPGDR